jgi:hypothetical protein
MIIDLRRESTGLEYISKGDVLLFPDRKEVVKDIDIVNRIKRDLYCVREIPLKDKDYKKRIEEVAYIGIDILKPSSEGAIYRRRKIEKVTKEEDKRKNGTNNSKN